MTSLQAPKDYASRLERLEREVRALQRRSTLGSASISQGNLTVRDGGSVIIRDGGNLTGLGGGLLSWEGNAAFTGDLNIGGDTTLGGNLTFAPGVVPPEALSYRTEGKTFGNSNTATSKTNAFSLTTAVTVPSWAASTSLIAISSVYVEGTDDGADMGARTAIDGNNGNYTHGRAYLGVQSIPTMHRRDFSPSGSFNVVVTGGLSPVSSVGFINVTTVVMAVFTN